jgi:hypothetical protein
MLLLVCETRRHMHARGSLDDMVKLCMYGEVIHVLMHACTHVHIMHVRIYVS